MPILKHARVAKMKYVRVAVLAGKHLAVAIRSIAKPVLISLITVFHAVMNFVGSTKMLVMFVMGCCVITVFRGAQNAITPVTVKHMW
jgi:sorbitol-specific phosphotransferase system component IIC